MIANYRDNMSYTEDQKLTLSQMRLLKSGFAIGSAGDYLGLPAGLDVVNVNKLGNYETDLVLGGALPPLNKRHDLFSSCLPAPQRGEPVTLNLGGQAKIYGDLPDKSVFINRVGGKNEDAVPYTKEAMFSGATNSVKEAIFLPRDTSVGSFTHVNGATSSYLAHDMADINEIPANAENLKSGVSDTGSSIPTSATSPTFDYERGQEGDVYAALEAAGVNPLLAVSSVSSGASTPSGSAAHSGTNASESSGRTSYMSGNSGSAVKTIAGIAAPNGDISGLSVAFDPNAAPIDYSNVQNVEQIKELQNRLAAQDDDFEKMIANYRDNMSYTEDQKLTLSQMRLLKSGFAIGSAGDYLGLPAGLDVVNVNKLGNYETDLVLGGALPPLNKRHDLFSSCLPAPQRGEPVTLNLGGQAKIYGDLPDKSVFINRVGGKNEDAVPYTKEAMFSGATNSVKEAIFLPRDTSVGSFTHVNGATSSYLAHDMADINEIPANAENLKSGVSDTGSSIPTSATSPTFDYERGQEGDVYAALEAAGVNPLLAVSSVSSGASTPSGSAAHSGTNASESSGRTSYMSGNSGSAVKTIAGIAAPNGDISGLSVAFDPNAAPIDYSNVQNVEQIKELQNRLAAQDDDFEKMIANYRDNMSYTEDQKLTLSQMRLLKSGFAIGSAGDYLGLPAGLDVVNVNKLGNYETDLVLGGALPPLNKRHDLFSSCLPAPQRGEPVTLNLGGQAKIYGDLPDKSVFINRVGGKNEDAVPYTKEAMFSGATNSVKEAIFLPRDTSVGSFTHVNGATSSYLAHDMADINEIPANAENLKSGVSDTGSSIPTSATSPTFDYERGQEGDVYAALEAAGVNPLLAVSSVSSGASTPSGSAAHSGTNASESSGRTSYMSGNSGSAVKTIAGIAAPNGDISGLSVAFDPNAAPIDYSNVQNVEQIKELQNRLAAQDDDFEKMIANYRDNMSYTEDQKLTLSQMRLLKSGFAIGSAGDYLGLPAGLDVVNVNKLGNYETDLVLGGALPPLNKRHDLFSSCLPAPQRGEPVTLNLGGQAKIYGDLPDKSVFINRVGGKNEDAVPYTKEAMFSGATNSVKEAIFLPRDTSVGSFTHVNGATSSYLAHDMADINEIPANAENLKSGVSDTGSSIPTSATSPTFDYERGQEGDVYAALEAAGVNPLLAVSSVSSGASTPSGSAAHSGTNASESSGRTSYMSGNSGSAVKTIAGIAAPNGDISGLSVAFDPNAAPIDYSNVQNVEQIKELQNRLAAQDDDFEKMIANYRDNMSYTEDQKLTLSQMRLLKSGFAIGSAGDYLGLPAGLDVVNVNKLGNYETDLVLGGALPPLNKRHDLFSSCLPAPQRGEPVTLNLGGQAKIYGDLPDKSVFINRVGGKNEDAVPYTKEAMFSGATNSVKEAIFLPRDTSVGSFTHVNGATSSYLAHDMADINEIPANAENLKSGVSDTGSSIPTSATSPTFDYERGQEGDVYAALEAAGVNPLLAVSSVSSGASTPSGSAAHSGTNASESSGRTSYMSGNSGSAVKTIAGIAAPNGDISGLSVAFDPNAAPIDYSNVQNVEQIKELQNRLAAQ
ncbi:unnamed protein product, partial [Cylicocyclus nassatus]